MAGRMRKFNMDDPLMVSFSTGLKSPGDMLSKLKRELNRLADASAKHLDVVDHGINGAWTAWHITDWVWKAKFEWDVAARKSLESGHVDLPSGDRARFNECLARECPELALCRDVANGIKHFLLDPKPKASQSGAKGVSTETRMVTGTFVLGQDSLDGGTVLGGPGVVKGATIYRLRILDDSGTQRDGVEVINAVVDFWMRFMAQHHIR